RSDFRLVQVISAGAAATKVWRSQFEQFNAWNRAQEFSRFARNILSVGQMASVVIGDALPSRLFGDWPQAKTRQKHAYIKHAPAKSVCATFNVRRAKNQVIFVHGRTATGRIRDDGIHILRKS